MSKKNENWGQGSFNIEPSGKIRFRFYYIDEFDRRRQKSFSADTEDECVDRANEFLCKLKQIKQGIPVNATVADIIRNKLESDYKKNYTGIQGYERNIKTLAIIERYPIGSMRIADVKELHIELFLQSITHYSKHMIEKIYGMLRTAFNIAYDKKIITENIIQNRGLRCPQSNKKAKKVRGMTDSEQVRFVKALEEYKVNYGAASYRLQLLIELYSGLRMGEINALKPENINFKKGYIHVERTITIVSGKNVLKEGTKTPAGVRDVPISGKLRPILEEALAQMKDNPKGLIFTDHKTNGVVSTGTVNGFFNRVCKRAGIEMQGQHSLRHTFATRCIEAGIDAIVLKTWLGHTDIHVTLDTYSDVFDRMNLGAISKLDAFMDCVMK